MKKLYIFLYLAINTVQGICQTHLEQEIKNHLSEIKCSTLEQCSNEDLLPLKTSIGNARVVFLGEQDHGDAATFQAKTRIVKYMHEQMGFDVLLFECDFWALEKIWQEQSKDSSYVNKLIENSYKVWAACQQTQDLYAYIAKSARSTNPLISSGIDCRHASAYSKKNYLKELNICLRINGILEHDSLNAHRFLSLCSLFIEKEYKCKFSKEEQAFFNSFLEMTVPKIQDPFWKQDLISMQGAANNVWEIKKEQSTQRDEYMAKNLLWFIQTRYPDKKIMVWAQSSHSAKNIDLLAHANKLTLGSEVYKAIGNKMYNLAFTSLEGKSGRVGAKPFKVGKVKEKSLEYYLAQNASEYAFVSFKDMDVKEAFYAKLFWHRSISTNWSKLFDGVFYIKEMYLCDEKK